MNIIAWNNPRKKEKGKEGVGRERERKKRKGGKKERCGLHNSYKIA